MNRHGFDASHVEDLLRAQVVGTDPEARHAGLSGFLYARWYSLARTTAAVEACWPPLAGMLRVAQAEALGWQPAIVMRRGAGGVAVAQGRTGRARALLRGGYAHADGSVRAGLPLGVGDDVMVVPRSGAVVSEGWWRTWGGGWDPRVAPPDAVRMYLGPKVSQLPVLVGRLTAGLERCGEPWLMKVAVQESHLGRADALVIYLRNTSVFGDIVGWASGGLRAEPGPPLTAQLATGVAWADDPGDGRSFGESRCEIVAAALDRTVDGDADAFLAAANEEFLAAGLDPAAPHRRGDSRG